jgi:hypothetical protein
VTQSRVAGPTIVATMGDTSRTTSYEEADPPTGAVGPSVIREVRSIVRSRLSWVVVLAVTVLSCLTYVVSQRASERDVPAIGHVAPPQSVVDLVNLELLFGGVFVATYAGMLGAKNGPRRRAATAPYPSRPRLEPLIALMLLFAPGLVLVHLAAYGLTFLISAPLETAAVTGRSDLTVGETTSILVGGWLALLPFGALGYMTGTALRRPMSGLVIATVFLGVDAAAGTVLPRIDPWWSPIGNAAALVGATASSAWFSPIVVTVVYVAVSAAVITRIAMASERASPARWR